MRIYTRKGDSGKTGVYGGQRIPKSDIRIEANGTLDELNSLIGVVRSLIDDDDKDTILFEIQKNLMVIMSLVATPSELIESNPRRLPQDCIVYLEKELDRITEKGSMSQDFVLPGGTPGAAFLHQARAVCRRAERRLWSLNETDKVADSVLPYINRLSDLLFAMARDVNSDAGISEYKWKSFNRKSVVK